MGWALGIVAALLLCAAVVPMLPLLVLGSRLADWWYPAGWQLEE